jgi:hypothetical protein
MSKRVLVAWFSFSVLVCVLAGDYFAALACFNALVVLTW